MPDERRRFIKRMTDRHGRRRFYFVRDGYPRATLPGQPGEPAFEAAYREALAAPPRFAGKAPAPPRRAAEGSFSDLCRRYYQSARFIALGPTTRRTYTNAIERLREAHGHKPVALLDRRGVKKIVAGYADRPGAANQVLRILRMLLAFAVDEEDRTDNPAAGIKKLKMPGDGFVAWSEDRIAQFRARHKPGTKARLALDLLLHTAQRRGDIVRLGAHMIERERLCFRQRKTDVYLEIPVHPALAAAIRDLPADAPAFLLTEYGKPFAPAGFGNWFRDRCAEAGLPRGYNAHGLRKAALRRLAEAGCTVHEIMAISGHKTLAEVERYTKAASRALMAEDAIRKVAGKPSANPEKIPVVSRVMALPTGIEPVFPD